MNNNTVQRNIEINVTGNVGDAEAKIRSLESKLIKLQATAARMPSSFADSGRNKMSSFNRSKNNMQSKLSLAEARVVKSRVRLANDLNNELLKERNSIIKGKVSRIFTVPISRRLSEMKAEKRNRGMELLREKGISGLRPQDEPKFLRTNDDAIANSHYRSYEAKKAAPSILARRMAKTDSELDNQRLRKYKQFALNDTFSGNVESGYGSAPDLEYMVKQNRKLARYNAQIEKIMLKNKARELTRINNIGNKERGDASIHSIFNRPIEQRLADAKYERYVRGQSLLESRGIKQLRPQTASMSSRPNQNAVSNYLYRQYEGSRNQGLSSNVFDRLASQRNRNSRLEGITSAFNNSRVNSGYISRNILGARQSMFGRMSNSFMVNGRNNAQSGIATVLSKLLPKFLTRKSSDRDENGQKKSMFAGLKGAVRTGVLFLGSIMMLTAAISRLTQGFIALGEMVSDVADDKIRTDHFKSKLSEGDRTRFTDAIQEYTRLTGATKGQAGAALSNSLSTLSAAGKSLTGEDITRFVNVAYAFAETTPSASDGSKMNVEEAAKKISGIMLGNVKPQQAGLPGFKRSNDMGANLKNIEKMLQRKELYDLVMNRVSPRAETEKMKNSPRALIEEVTSRFGDMIDEFLQNSASYVQSMFGVGKKKDSPLPESVALFLDALGQIGKMLEKLNATGDDTLGRTFELFARIANIIANIWVAIKPVVDTILNASLKLAEWMQIKTADWAIPIRDFFTNLFEKLIPGWINKMKSSYKNLGLLSEDEQSLVDSPTIQATERPRIQDFGDNKEGYKKALDDYNENRSLIFKQTQAIKKKKSIDSGFNTKKGAVDFISLMIPGLEIFLDPINPDSTVSNRIEAGEIKGGGVGDRLYEDTDSANVKFKTGAERDAAQLEANRRYEKSAANTTSTNINSNIRDIRTPDSNKQTHVGAPGNTTITINANNVNLDKDGNYSLDYSQEMVI